MKSLLINSIEDGRDRKCLCEIPGTESVIDPLCTEFLQPSELSFNGKSIRVKAFVGANKKGSVHLFLDEKAVLSFVTTVDDVSILILEVDERNSLELVINYS
jgi:hypothetical protein